MIKPIRTVEQICEEIEIKRREEAEKIQLANPDAIVLSWEILDSKYKINASQARGLAFGVHELANELRRDGLKGTDIPKKILQKSHFVKFSEDFPFLFKYSMNEDSKSMHLIEMVCLAQHRCERGEITAQECRNIQEHAIFDYAGK